MPTTTSTILFTDAVESTVLRTELGETAADRLFREHEHALHGVVTSHRGSVVKTAGDGIMASFESATDAVQAAVAVQQCVTRDFPALRVRVGLGVGDVSWEDGDCFGLPVVLAARLQSEAEPGQILVSSLVRMLAGDRAGVQFRSIDRLSLKGLPEPVDAFEVEWTPVSEEAGADAFQVPLPSALAVATPLPFVGRDREWSVVQDAWAMVQSSVRQTVLIGGEAGAGKTRLAFEFARWAHGTARPWPTAPAIPSWRCPTNRSCTRWTICRGRCRPNCSTGTPSKWPRRRCCCPSSSGGSRGSSGLPMPTRIRSATGSSPPSTGCCRSRRPAGRSCCSSTTCTGPVARRWRCSATWRGRARLHR